MLTSFALPSPTSFAQYKKRKEKKKKILLGITHRLLKAQVSHGDSSAVSLFTAKYSAATAAPLQTEHRIERSAELRASAKQEGGKKKRGAYDTRRIFL